MTVNLFYSAKFYRNAFHGFIYGFINVHALLTELLCGFNDLIK